MMAIGCCIGEVIADDLGRFWFEVRAAKSPQADWKHAAE
jgi:hypothetical protein